jgi:hypothetical protein
MERTIDTAPTIVSVQSNTLRHGCGTLRNMLGLLKT